MSQTTQSDDTSETLQEEVALHSSLTPEPGLAVETEPQPNGDLPKLRPLIFNRDYMLLWSGQVISALGSGISGIVFPLLILAITTSIANPQGDTVIAGLAGAIGSLPYLLFSLPAGALIDRWNRKRVMMICDAFRALNSASIPLAIFLDGLTVWQLLINAFIEGCFFVFFNIAEVAALPRVVEKRQLPQASAQNEGGGIAAGLVGPPLGTLLFQTVSRAFPFLLDAVSYAFSVASLAFIKTEFQGERHKEERHLLVEIREGLSWLWNQPLIRFMAFLTGGLNLVNSGTFLILIVLAKELGAEDYQIGFMVSIGALGGILGAVVGGTIQKRFTFGQVIITTGWIATIIYGFYIFAPNFIILGILMALSWMIGPIYNVVQFSYRLALIPERLLGRVNSTFRLLAFGFQPVGAAMSGILLSAIGTTNTLLVNLVILILLSAATTINSHVLHAKRIEELTGDQPAS
jgi:MFS family permease